MKRQIILFLLLTVFFIPQSYGRIVELIEGKDVKVSAEIKSTEITKTFTSAPRQRISFSGITVDIEILNVKAIETRIEVLARAWDTKNKPIGFGEDGSVEIERFIIYNPRICVDDPNGTIIREYTDFATKELKRFISREDPLQAILETLVHNIKIAGKRNASVIKNKVGNTTLTLYPAAGAAEPVDGLIFRDVIGTPETWAALRDGVGTGADPAGAIITAQLLTAATSPYYYYLTRSDILFDSSPVPDAASITSVTLSLWGSNKSDAQSKLPTTDIYTSTPASTSNLVAGDFIQIGSVSQTGSPMTYAAFTVGAYNDYSFNATGIGNISKTGISKFAWRNVNYDVANVDPAINESGGFYLHAKAADEAGTSNDPKLVIVYTSTETFTPQVTWW